MALNNRALLAVEQARDLAYRQPTGAQLTDTVVPFLAHPLKIATLVGHMADCTVLPPRTGVMSQPKFWPVLAAESTNARVDLCAREFPALPALVSGIRAMVVVSGRR